MDEKIDIKITPFPQKIKSRHLYLAAFSGGLIFLVIWLILIPKKETFAHSFKIALPWALPIAVAAILFLCALAFHLLKVIRERAVALERLDQGFKMEIIERVRTEETKRKLEIALLQGQKLQAIGTLAGGIAHDFNNILYAIIGYVEMARDDVPKEAIVYRNLGKVLEAAARGQDLVARILAFGRRHIHQEFQAISLKLITESVLDLLKPTIPASVILNVSGLSDEYIILGDQTQMHQVFVNIINNAVDAMDGEGSVTIKVGQVLAEDPFLKQFPTISYTNYYRIDIIDTGSGMDPSTMERIYEPFFTTKEVGKGTGLGLSTVHGIIKEHQGAITVTSQLGKGSTFTFLLPQYQPP